jgi:hypothetical protein
MKYYILLTLTTIITLLSTSCGNISTENSTESTISQWIGDNLNLVVPNTYFNAETVSYNSSYGKDLSKQIRTTLSEEEWIGKTAVKEIKSDKGFVVVNLADEDYSKRIFITNHFIIISCHASAGSEGSSMVVDLDNMKAVLLEEMTVNSIDSNDEITVGKDYYDDEGHIWEIGKYNLKTKEYTFVSKER